MKILNTVKIVAIVFFLMFLFGCGGSGASGGGQNNQVTQNQPDVDNTPNTPDTPNTPVAQLSPNNSITSFSFEVHGVTFRGVITDQDILVGMPRENIGVLVAKFKTDGAASVTVNNVVQKSGVTQNEFSANVPVDYIVTAQNGNTRTYHVKVVSNDNYLYSFALIGSDGVKYSGVITEDYIVVSAPSAAIGDMKVVFTTSAASVKVDGQLQISNSTSRNFVSGQTVVYTVTAHDGSVKHYNVTVLSKDTLMKEFSLIGTDNVRYPGVIEGSRIVVSVPINAVGDMIVKFKTNGQSVAVGNNIMTSGVSRNHFTLGEPVDFVVTAANGRSDTYHVVLLGSNNSMMSFGVVGRVSGRTYQGNIRGQNITVVIPAFDVTGRSVVNFATNGAHFVRVGNVDQVSGVTKNSLVFGQPISYQVVAFDGSIRTYTVEVVRQDNVSMERLPDNIADNHVVDPSDITLSHNGRYAYIPDRDSRSVLQYSVDRVTGNLTFMPIQGIANTQNHPINIVASDDDRYVYVLNNNSGSISTFAVNNNGSLRFVGNVNAGTAPTQLVLSPVAGNPFMYTSSFSNTLTAYTRNRTTGVISRAGTLRMGPLSPSLAVSADGVGIYALDAASIQMARLNTDNGNITANGLLVNPNAASRAGSVPLPLIGPIANQIGRNQVFSEARNLISNGNNIYVLNNTSNRAVLHLTVLGNHRLGLVNVVNHATGNVSSAVINQARNRMYVLRNRGNNARIESYRIHPDGTLAFAGGLNAPTAPNLTLPSLGVSADGRFVYLVGAAGAGNQRIVLFGVH